MQEQQVVEGFLYVREDDRSHSICSIVDRAPPDLYDLEEQPRFIVEFEDGETRDVLGAHLRPWYRVE